MDKITIILEVLQQFELFERLKVQENQKFFKRQNWFLIYKELKKLNQLSVVATAVKPEIMGNIQDFAIEYAKNEGFIDNNGKPVSKPANMKATMKELRNKLLDDDKMMDCLQEMMDDFTVGLENAENPQMPPLPPMFKQMQEKLSKKFN